jgi:hypothetical protein
MAEPRRRPLTPNEIRALQIRRIGLRKGYDASEVHELLKRLADETANRDSIISGLASRLRRAETEAYARRHGTLPAAANQLHIDQMLAQIDQRERVQHYTDELIATAQQGAARIVAQGREQASQILRQAYAAAQCAADAYRARAGNGYRPEQEELAQLLGLAQWAQAQLVSVQAHITDTNTRVSNELTGIAERLKPAVESAGSPGPGQPP